MRALVVVLALVGTPAKAPSIDAPLFAQLAKTDGNVLVSPPSLRTVLALARAGAAGKTRTEIEKLVGTGVIDAVGVTSVAVAPGVTLEDAWKREAESQFHASIGPAPADDTTLAVSVVNTLAFKGTWQNKFDESQTTARDFTLDATHKKSVPMMHLRGTLSAAHLADVDVVALPYDDAKTFMVLVVPRKIGRAPVAADLARVTSKLRAQDVELWLPRFALSKTNSLEAPLTALGMKSAWCTSGGADFSKLGHTGAGPLCAESLTQQVKVEVDEKGTVASAITELRMVAAEGESEPQHLEVRCDRPFLFEIRGSDASTASFIGRVSDPAPDVATEPRGKPVPAPSVAPN